MAFEVTRVQLGEMGTNGYILIDNESGDCAFIDVGDYGERLKAFLKNKGIEKLRYILLTHGHLQNAKYGPDGLLRSARDNGCDLVIFGHTHEKLCEYHDGIYLVNPGSLGHPHDGVPSYAVIDVSQKGILVSHMEL